MCVYCADSACLRGEVCNGGADFSGLLPSGVASPHVGPHNETKKYSQRNHFESEHVLPKKALDVGGVAYTYGAEPTVSIPYGMHRGGVSGAGGGVSSTGSSHTAQGWSDRLGGMLANGNWVEAIKQAALDGINSAGMTGHLNDGMISAYMQNVNYHASMGRITQLEAGQINNFLFNAYLNWKAGR